MSAVGLKGRCCRSGPERAPRSEGHEERLGRRCEEFDSLTAIELKRGLTSYRYVMITTRFYRHRVGNINLRECAAISVRTRRDCAVLKPRPTRRMFARRWTYVGRATTPGLRRAYSRECTRDSCGDPAAVVSDRPVPFYSVLVQDDTG